MKQLYKLEADLYQRMLELCRLKAPKEACGLLGGASRLCGDVLFPMENLDDSAESYRMDGKKVLEVMRQLDEAGLGLTAIYHSHPGTPARPSEADIAQAYLPVTYLILSLSGTKPVLRGFYILEGEVTEIPVEIVEKAGGKNCAY